MNRYKFYSTVTGALICEGTAAECAEVLQVDYNYIYELAQRSPMPKQTIWRVEVIRGVGRPESQISPKMRRRMDNAAILKEQRDLMRKNGCDGCRHWGKQESNGGEGCGFILLGRGCRKINPDGSCGSREAIPKEPAAD